MVCFSPYYQKETGLCFPCGQCLSCTIKRRRAWVTRLYLENIFHTDACFVTLTYNDDNLPANGSLVKRDFQLFIKRLRKAAYPVKLRYYACGEYGTKSQRPHYHAIIFGLPYTAKALFESCWRFGYVYLGDVTHNSISYVAGYVTKKQSHKDFPDYMQKEFSVMSLKPAIGSAAIPYIASALSASGVSDVPPFLRIGGKKYVIPKFLRRKLEPLLFSEEWIEALKKDKLDALKSHTQQLVLKHFGFWELHSDTDGYYHYTAYQQEYKQKRYELEARQKIQVLKEKF